MRLRRETTALLSATLMAIVSVSCASQIKVRKSDPIQVGHMNNVAVLLFTNSGPATHPHIAEMVTDAFSIELSRYFPGLIDRYRVRTFLRSAQVPENGTLTPAQLRALGEALEVDGIFVGTITGYSEKGSFLGWNGQPYFRMNCRLLSTHSCHALITARVDVKKGYALPLENPRDQAIYGVREMTRQMRLSERFGPAYITRSDPLWKKAMQEYERRHFWNAAELFGTITGRFARNSLRDEATLCMGRCLEELGYSATACDVYRDLTGSLFEAQALYRIAAVRYGESDIAEVLRIKNILSAGHSGGEEDAAVRYMAGMLLLESGRETGEAARLLESIPVGSAWRRFARFALASPLRASGDREGTLAALEEASSAGGITESERRLRERALMALGDFHYTVGNREEASLCYLGVRGEYKPAARLAAAWTAAEDGNFSDALALLDRVTGDGDPHRSAEAFLLAGSCRARLGRWKQSADDFARAIDRCEDWEKDEEREAEFLSDLRRVKGNMEEERRRVEPEIVSLLLEAEEGERLDRLRNIRGDHRAMTLSIQRIQREIVAVSDVATHRLCREEIREKAAFSLAHARFEAKRLERRVATLGEDAQ